MKLRHLFTINFPFASSFGILGTFFPCFISSLYGLTADDALNWVTRLVGGSFLGLGTLMWFGIRTQSIEAKKAIAIALLVQNVVGCIASIVFQLTGKVNIFGWFSLALHGMLALGYAWFLFVSRELKVTLER